MASLAGMKLGGFYDDHSAAQAQAVALLSPLIEDAVARMELPNGLPNFAVVDYGCSEGRNSIALLTYLVKALMARGAEATVTTVHSDLPTNNFNKLFTNLSSGEGYLQVAGTGRAFAFATGASFYGPVVPPRSAHFGLSVFAVHWLDERPKVPVDNHVFFPAGGPESRAAIAAQADAELTRFYQHRALELSPGAKLLVLTIGRREPNTAGAPELVGCRALYDLINATLQDFVKAGLVDEEAYQAFVFPGYFRSPREYLEPLQRKGSPVEGAFVPDDVRLIEMKCPYLKRWRETGDVMEYARSYTGFIRAWCEPVLFPALVPSGLADAFFERMARRVEREPMRWANDYLCTVVLLTRSETKHAHV